MLALPNVRQLFIPDPGHTIADVDLAQADAQVVAWEAGDEMLKEVFRDPNGDLHTANSIDIFGHSDNPKVRDKNRKKAKAGVHATNYYVRPRTLAIALGITVKEAEHFINRWFQIHPSIKRWQEKIEDDLNKTKTIYNKFGFRRRYFHNSENLLSEALAWIPQSTVALVINAAIDNMVQTLPEVKHNLQVHDSAIFQYKTEDEALLLPVVEAAFKVVIPYDDPLIIPAGIKTSTISWGDCKDKEWPRAA